jgi:hypothetical protein
MSSALLSYLAPTYMTALTSRSTLQFSRWSFCCVLRTDAALSLLYPVHRSVDICAELSNILGCEVCPGNIRFALAVASGRNCSAKYKCIWDIIDDLGLVRRGASS